MRRLLTVCLSLLCIYNFSCSINKNIEQGYNLQPFVENPRVFYGETGFPNENELPTQTCESLSLEEIYLIQNKVSEVTDKPVWFARVPMYSSQGKREQIWVYLAPDIMKDRYRSGSTYIIQINDDKYGELRAKISSPSQYIQVSLPGKKFSNILETPQACDLPIQYPYQRANENVVMDKVLSEKDLIGLLDYVRNPESYSAFADYKTYYQTHDTISDDISFFTPRPVVMSEIVITKPVMSIEVISDEYKVWLGFAHSYGASHGVQVKIKKTENGYRIIEWGYWIS